MEYEKLKGVKLHTEKEQNDEEQKRTKNNPKVPDGLGWLIGDFCFFLLIILIIGHILLFFNE